MNKAVTTKDGGLGLDVNGMHKPEPGTIRVVFDVPSATFDALDNDITDVLEAVYDAGVICDFLTSGIACGGVDPDAPGLMSILRMTGKTLTAVRNKQGEALDMLDMVLRHHRGEVAKAELARDRLAGESA